jgi:cobalt transporter subunit CbtB
MAQAQSIGTQTTPIAQVVAPACLALVLGAFLLIGTGFATIPAVHNAAHDARHAFAFPCH